jgi:predicted transposase YbfD/YdcC
MPHGAPSQDVFLAVLGALNPEKFSATFQAWANLISLRIGANDKHIAVDGKTSRRSFDAGREQPAIHTVSAWLAGAGLVLGQCKTREKSNEITAIPELLRTLDLGGTTITIDAMGCQTAIAEVIVQGGGDYVLAVKDNQPTLHSEVQDVFIEVDDARTRTVDEPSRPHCESYEEADKAHGRVEVRKLRICRKLDYLTTCDRWPGVSFIAEVTRERTVIASGKTSIEVSHYIGSGPLRPACDIAHIIRRHWSIENELHWVLDMAFNEDQARHRARNTAQNFTTLRHFALCILRQDQSRKVGIANARKRAGFDRNYLIRLMTGHAP